GPCWRRRSRPRTRCPPCRTVGLAAARSCRQPRPRVGDAPPDRHAVTRSWTDAGRASGEAARAGSRRPAVRLAARDGVTSVASRLAHRGGRGSLSAAPGPVQGHGNNRRYRTNRPRHGPATAMNTTSLVVIAKSPVPGRVKTRLCPPCTPIEAAHIAEAALSDTLSVVADTPATARILALDGPPGPWITEGSVIVPQLRQGLDERLANALAAVTGPALP